MHLIKVAFIGLLGLYFGAASAEPGFLPATSAALPAEVRTSVRKVLELWTPAIMTSIPESQYLKFKAQLNKNSKNARAFMRDKFNAIEIQFCIDHKMPVCPLTEAAGRGSAFVTDSGVMFASRHDFYNGDWGLGTIHKTRALSWKMQMQDRQLQGIATTDIEEFKANPLKYTRFILVNASGEIVFNSSVQAFRFLRFGNLTRFAGEVDIPNQKVNLRGEDRNEYGENYSGAGWVVYDSVQIQLSVSLPQIKVAQENCEPGNGTFNTGYAAGTTSRAKLGALDAKDRELSVSAGHLLTQAQFEQRGADWDDLRSFVAEMGRRPLLVSDADATSGMSGGPVLNVNGEVCGLFKGIFPGNENILVDARAKFYKMFGLISPLNPD